MATYKNDLTGDIVTVFGPAEQFLIHKGGYTLAEQLPAGGGDVFDPFELKGADLENALEAWGLPKAGTADEKRQRLHDHLNTPSDDIVVP